MSGKPTEPSAQSRRIKDQALAIFRDTRSRLDPDMLDRLKAKIEAGQAAKKAAESDHMPLSRKGQEESVPVPPRQHPKSYVHNAYINTQEIASRPVQPTAPVSKTHAPKSPIVLEDAPSQYDAAMSGAVDENGAELVDRQKVARIVLEYMKNREERSRH